MERHDVVIIGAGPAGLACAAQLRLRGVTDVVMLEREAEAGGVPRHCGHWGFGWESHRRLMSGPGFAARLRQDAEGVDVRTRHSVLQLSGSNELRVHTPDKGIAEMEARHVVLATGARESTRAARFFGGTRSAAVMNTGTLQQLVYLKAMKPFERPVIIGAEWVSFSALMTCAHAGIRPAAMIAEQLEAPTAFRWGARLRYGVPIHLQTRVVAIQGTDAVTGVEVERAGQRSVIACDGVIVSGAFVPEDALLAGNVSAVPPTRVGNVQGALKTAGRCVAEARGIADDIADKLAGALR